MIFFFISLKNIVTLLYIIDGIMGRIYILNTWLEHIDYIIYHMSR